MIRVQDEPVAPRSMREKLEEAFDAAFPRYELAIGFTREEAITWATAVYHRDHFTRLLDAEAWLDAAMMLVPDDWTGFVPVRGGNGEEAWLWPVVGTMNKGYRTTAPTSAEALFAAIERARTV